MCYVGNGEIEPAACLEGTQSTLPVDSYVGDALQFQIGFAHCAFSARLFLVLFWQHVLTLAGECQQLWHKAAEEKTLCSWIISELQCLSTHWIDMKWIT